MKVISNFLEKGGSGKTETAVNLGVGLAQKGLRVLLCENDPQGNLTKRILRYNESFDVSKLQSMKDAFDKSVKDTEVPILSALSVLETYVSENEFDFDMSSVLDKPRLIHKAILETPYENLWIIPGSHDLSTSDMKLKSSIVGATDKLRDALALVEDKFDVVIIDNPPFTNALTYNALNACQNEGDLLIMPIKVDSGGLEGLYTTLTDVMKWLEAYPLGVDIRILPVMNNRTIEDRSVIELLRYMFGNLVFNTTIRYQSKPIVDASLRKEPLILNSDTPVANDYRELIEEVYLEIMGGQI